MARKADGTGEDVQVMDEEVWKVQQVGTKRPNWYVSRGKRNEPVGVYESLTAARNRIKEATLLSALPVCSMEDGIGVYRIPVFEIVVIEDDGIEDVDT